MIIAAVYIDDIPKMLLLINAAANNKAFNSRNTAKRTVCQRYSLTVRAAVYQGGIGSGGKRFVEQALAAQAAVGVVAAIAGKEVIRIQRKHLLICFLQRIR